MKPTKDKILLVADKPKEKTASGLLIKEDWKTLPPLGTIESVGEDVKAVKVGDRVLFERYGSIMIDSEKNLRMCLESHILATVEE